MRFIDLFAGLGGFHLALARLGHKCVFASEIDGTLQAVYEQNFGFRPAGDIRSVKVEDIPEHDVICAGFPCQPFSKAGSQRGFDCPKWGDLFDYVMLIAKHHKPQFMILENVPNLERHNGGRTWEQIKSALTVAGYDPRHERLSPHHFGIPQIRDRMFIVASRRPLRNFSWPEKSHAPTTIASFLDRAPEDARPISDRARLCLEVWQEFLDLFPEGEELPSFPIWTTEFGATYPFGDTTPHAVGKDALGRFRGSHGLPLRTVPANERMQCLPSYARTAEDVFPAWKSRFIGQNRDFYRAHRSWIDRWLPNILQFPPSWQKLEWNCKGDERRICQHILQFRASGVRVKRPSTIPSLVAMTTTQVPIVGWESRYMTARECARLQGMRDLPNLPAAPTRAFEALGNAVNADLVEMIAEALFTSCEPHFEISTDRQCLSEASLLALA